MKECPQCRFCYQDSLSHCPHDNRGLVASISGDVVVNGRYVLEKRLGKGGMGIVFKAKHKFLKSLHAVKVISPNIVEEDKSLLIRFRQEAVLAASIHHPNVISVTDFGVEADNMPYLVMEFINGVALSDFLSKERQMSPGKTFEIFLPIASGVGEAHRNGIVHRDLKPQNIMIQKGLPFRQAVKVLDFGLAKIKSTESFGSLVQAQTMSILGSPTYMSPEQWENDNVDHRADLYALGVMLFQMLTGHLPFDGNSIPTVMYRHLRHDPPTFKSLGVSLSPDIEAVLKKSLEKDRENRFQSADEMLAALENALLDANVPLTVKIDTAHLIHDTSPLEEKSPTQKDALSESQRERLYTYLDLSTNHELLADNVLAKEFLQAQDRAEEAKVMVSEADKLMQEFAEAQKAAESAQQRAQQAQQRIEDDVRRRVEAEMQNKLAAEQQARQKAEAEALRLAQEAEARKAAEERAKQLAEAALAAERQAEAARQQAELAAQKREAEESVRRQAELEAQRLAAEIADAKRKYEQAQQAAEAEALKRAEAEAKQKNIEERLKLLAETEAERHKQAEAEALKQIQEQASRYEQEALEAQEKVEQARRLAEIEAQRRAEAEAAQKRSELEAKQLAEDIFEVQKRIERIQNQVQSGSRNKIENPHADPHQASVMGFFDQPGETSNAVNSANPKEAVKDSFVKFGNETLAQIGHADSQRRQHETGKISQTGQIQQQSRPDLSGEIFTEPPRKSLLPVFVVGAVVLLATIGIGGYALSSFLSDGLNSPNQNISAKTNVVNGNSSNPIGGGTTAAGNRIATKMSLIKGSNFKMGRDDIGKPDDEFFGNQYPAHEIRVGDFYLDKTEVTNEEYAAFVQATNHKSPPGWKDGKPPAGQENFPVTSVSKTDADAFAKWLSDREKKTFRLPTEQEWEFAARNGSQQTTFPWGNTWQNDSANVGVGQVRQVGASSDTTLTGEIKDMLGNVAEWTSSSYDLYKGHPKTIEAKFKAENVVVRGGYSQMSQNLIDQPQWLITFRTPTKPNMQNPLLGFRLVSLP